MGGMSVFLSQNKLRIPNLKLVVSKEFGTPRLDDAGSPVLDEKGDQIVDYAEWEFRRISAEEDSVIRAMATEQVQNGVGMYMPKFNGEKYSAELIAASCVYPNLRDKELNDSYGTVKASDLLKKMLSAGEIITLQEEILKYQGFDALLEKKNAVKN